jgi:pyruvate dehydrogenase E1 component beta subunit
MTVQEMTYREAIIAAQRDELDADPTVLLLGEDIGESGGVFKNTAGLIETFGPARVCETPIAETGFVGAALGLAVAGYRPIVEVMFADFLAVCFDQVVNEIAKHRFMSGGRMAVPLVIRTAAGGGLQFAAQHSQTAESWLLPFPGLKVFAPACPADAYGLLRAAVRDPNPVVVLEHKALLNLRGTVTLGVEGIAETDGPAVRRAGTDATVVASLAMVPRALDAAAALADEGIAVEVIDLRILRPLTIGPIVESVRKTGRLVTVEEQPRAGGWGAEVVAQVVAEALDRLQAPPERVAMPDHPLPCSKPLEEATRPSAEHIAAAVRKLL